MITDNYLRRGYGALQSQLHPDSTFFLGDLFDGGREWKTRNGDFVDPKWGQERSEEEQSWVNTWHRRYGEDYWLKEYARFGSIFFDRWQKPEKKPRPSQRGRKVVASLPGNHDLGFGAQVQVSVRDRFSAYFGDVNRVDVIGNHSIVSVDTVSLSADTSFYKDIHDLRPIYGPVNEFLDGVQFAKRKAAMKELEFWHGPKQDHRYEHTVEELEDSDLDKFPKVDPGSKAPDLPTILLTHVPLYREPGTPCGKQREHWPPAKPPKGQTEPVNPDPPNAISVVMGYQYQNVLNEEDSIKLIKSIGNVKHVFSGDDHDYCEIVHSDAKENVREITVKSLSMVMSVANPGFVMVSLYNPIDADGKPISGSESTMQTHLCLLPNQLHTYKQYITFLIISLVLFSIRAYLVPIFNLTPFALEPDSLYNATSGSLPTYKDKVEPPDLRSSTSPIAQAGSSATGFPSRLRSSSSGLTSNGRWSASRKPSLGRKGWGVANAGPRIDLSSHDFYTADRKGWRAGTGRRMLGVVGWEMLTTSWRCIWMVVLFWVYLNRNG